MNKEEIKNKALDEFKHSKNYQDAFEFVMYLLNELDTVQKKQPVPDYIADYITTHKKEGRTLLDIGYIVYEFYDGSKEDDWIREHEEAFIQAWVNGHVTEKA